MFLPEREDPICIVDDDAAVCDSLSILLRAHGFDVVSYNSGGALLEAASLDRLKVLVMDQHMPGLNGLDVVAVLRNRGMQLPVVLITANPDDTLTRRAANLQVLSVLEKPIAITRLVSLIRAGMSGRA